MYISLLQVIGQGSVLLHMSTFSTNNNNGETAMTVELPIDYAGVPRVKVLGVVARTDGELVADLIEISVSCKLMHEVRRGGWIEEWGVCIM